MNGIILGLAAAFLISLTNVYSRLHFDAGSTPVTFILARYLIVAVALGTGLALWQRGWRIERRFHRDVVIAGGFNVAGATCLAFAIARLEVSLAIAVLYLFPFFTLTFSSAASRQWPSPVMLLALAVAFIGLLLTLGVGASEADPIGILFALGAALNISASFVWAERHLSELDDLGRVFGLVLVGLIFAIALALGKGGVVWPLPNSTAWWTLLAATFSFGAATGAMFMAISRVGAANTALLMNLEPPATALLAVMLIGDSIAPVQMLGIAIVVSAVIAAQMHARAVRYRSA